MFCWTAIAVVAVLSAGLAHGADAQVVYRCGNAYSAQPCPNGRALDVSDGRSSAQKAQARKLKEQTEKEAQALDQARLKQEKAANRRAFEQDFFAAPSALEPMPTPEPDNKKVGSAYFTAKTLPAASSAPAAEPQNKTARKKQAAK